MACSICEHEETASGKATGDIQFCQACQDKVKCKVNIEFDVLSVEISMNS